MALKVGDKVRTENGDEGRVVMIYRDEFAALVRLREADPNATLVSVPMRSLTRIEAYAPAPEPPHAG